MEIRPIFNYLPYDYLSNANKLTEDENDIYNLDLEIKENPSEELPADSASRTHCSNGCQSAGCGTAGATCLGTCASCGVTCLGTCANCR